MKKKTIFQPIDDGNKDCGLACLEMLTHKPAEYFRTRLGIRTTRNTRKKDLLAELDECGYRVVQRGRVSGRTPLASLKHDALLFGRLKDDEKNPGHWAVWDPSANVLRDPNGYRAPYHVTWFATLKKK